METLKKRCITLGDQKPIIGISGGIGSGKSLVAKMLESLGSAVIDADSLAHQCLDTPDCIKQIQEWWGESVIASDLDALQSQVEQAFLSILSSEQRKG